MQVKYFNVCTASYSTAPRGAAVPVELWQITGDYHVNSCKIRF